MKNILRFIGEGGILMAALFLLACPTDPTPQPDPIKLTLTGTSKAPLQDGEMLVAVLMTYNVFDGGPVAMGMMLPGTTVFTFFNIDLADSIIGGILTGNIPQEAFFTTAGEYGVVLSGTSEQETQGWIYMNMVKDKMTADFKQGMNTLSWNDFYDFGGLDDGRV